MTLETKPFGDIITFTRASSAGRFNSSGVFEMVANDVPRLDYDPATLQPKGILIEEARTNLLLRSAEFDNAYWSAADVTRTPDAALAPDGTMSADKLVGIGSSSNKFVFRTVAGITAQQYTVSCFYKRAEHQYAFVQLFSGPFFTQTRIIVDLDTGLITHNIGGGTGSVVDCGNGWYRITLVATASSSGSGIAYFGGTRLPTSYQYTGDGGGVYAWGADLQAGAFPTSHIPTVASTVTRAADVASVNTLSPWYNSLEGTLFVEASTGGIGAGAGAITAMLSDNTTNNLMTAWQATAATLRIGTSTVAGVNQATLTSGGSIVNLGPQRIAFAYKLNDFAGSLNGGAVVTDVSGTIPAVTQLALGSTGVGAGSQRLNGHIRSLRYWPRRLTDVELQELTS